MSAPNFDGPPVGRRHLAAAVDPQPPSIDVDRLTEEAAIGTLLITGPSIRAEMLAILADDDPDDALHRVIVTVVRDMAERQAPIDILTVLAELRGHRLLGAGRLDVDLVARVFRLADAGSSTTGHLGLAYARTLVDTAVRRQVTEEAHRIVGLAHRASQAEFTDAVTDAVDVLLTRLYRSAAS